MESTKSENSHSNEGNHNKSPNKIELHKMLKVCIHNLKIKWKIVYTKYAI